jgi:hypothetical protein
MPTFLFAAVMVAAVAASAVPAAHGADTPPRLITSDGQHLQAVRHALRDGKDKAAAAFAADTVKKADAALQLEPPTVIRKPAVDVTTDPHEYASLSPYWWPDPAKPDGRPYIRKDGQFNPEREKFDLGRLETMSNAVRDLSLAYYLTGDERYAKKSAELIRVWFLDPATRMNPSLKYAQFVPGYTQPRASGVIEGLRFRRVIDGVGLLAGSPHWTPKDDAALKAWFAELLNYLQTSEQGQAEAGQPNNHGTWFHVQAACYALHAGDEAAARKLIEPAFKRLIASQLTADGMQPEEAARTLSFHYHRYNLLALIDLATLGDRVGVDLWQYRTDDGKSLRLAIDYLLPYALGDKPWPHEQIKDIKYGDTIEIFRRAANAYREPKFEDAVRRLRDRDPKDRRDAVDVLFPSTLK